MKLSKKTKFTLITLLIILNIILRFPTVPHEIGRDSFAVHALANSLSIFAYAKWWIHPASIIGSYPHSSPSAVPFLLSGIFQGTGIGMGSVILLYSMILGIFSIFAAYLMAGAIRDDDLFKFLVAFVFSTSQGIVTYTTWTAPTRTLFVVSLPLFIYLLLKTRTFNVRYSILTLIILTLLLVTHHYVYFTIPLIISFFAVVIVYRLKKYIKFVKIPENLVNVVLLASFLAMFIIPFFIRTFMEAEPRGYGGSRYLFIMMTLLPSYVRYIGVLSVFAVGGYIYLSLKRNKRFEEWYLLLALVGLAPLLYTVTYMKWFILSFASLLIAMGLVNVCKTYTRTHKKRYVVSFMVSLLLFSVIFTGYYQFIHFLDDPRPIKRHMEERTYTGALWIRDNIDKDKNIIAEPYISRRVLATGEVPTLTGGTPALVYGFISPNKLDVKQIYSSLSIEFYYRDPFKEVGSPPAEWFADTIIKTDINKRGSYAQRFVHRFNLSYFVENNDLSNTFTGSVRQTKNNIYDNGKIRVWDLGN